MIRLIEAQVLQAVSEGLRAKDIAQALNIKRNHASHIISRLCTLSIIRRNEDGTIDVLQKNPAIGTDEEVYRERTSRPQAKKKRTWTPEEKYYIAEHLRSGYSRHKLAKRFGMSSLDFNYWLIDMRVGVKDELDADLLAN